jgi:tetracycline repressor-like protein
MLTIAALAARRPELADELWKLHGHYCDRHERLEALLLLVGVGTTLPILKLYAAYEAFGSPVITSAPDRDDNATEELDPRQRAALTKRIRTRKALLDSAVQVIAEGTTSRLMEETATRAGIGLATVYKHFATKDDLIRAVYTRLLEPMLNQL